MRDFPYDCQFMLINKNAKWLKAGRDNTTVYLKYSEYKKDIKKRNEEAKEFKAIYDYQNKLTFMSPMYELPLLEKDSVLAEKRKVWHKNLAKDIYVEEALNVLAELKIKNYKMLVKN